MCYALIGDLKTLKLIWHCLLLAHFPHRFFHLSYLVDVACMSIYIISIKDFQLISPENHILFSDQNQKKSGFFILKSVAFPRRRVTCQKPRTSWKLLSNSFLDFKILLPYWNMLKFYKKNVVKLYEEIWEVKRSGGQNCSLSIMHMYTYTLIFFCKNVYFSIQAEYCYFSADFWLKIFLIHVHSDYNVIQSISISVK